MNEDFRATLNRYGLEEVRRWLHDRLHGRDTMCPPPDPREDERFYVRVSQLHGSARMSDQFKLHVRTAVCEAIRHATQHYPQGEWTDPEALDSLLLLAVDVSEGLVRSSLKDDIARSLWELTNKLPFDDDGIPLKRFAAMALLDARMPPPNPETFWKELWTVAATDGWTGFAGVVFEGLWRHVGLEKAARWFATAQPWDQEVMIRVLNDKLPAIIADSNPERVREVLETRLLPVITNSKRRASIWHVCRSHHLKLMLPVEVESFVRTFYLNLLVQESRQISIDGADIELADGLTVLSMQALPCFLTQSEQETGFSDPRRAAIVAEALKNEIRSDAFFEIYDEVANWERIGEMARGNAIKILCPALWTATGPKSKAVQLSS